MRRFLVTTTLAAVGLTLFVAQTQAGGPSGTGSGHRVSGSSHHGSMSGRRGESEHSYRANERFDYRRHGFKSFSWSHYRWSSYYHRYCYWAPSYGWCFYEPTYSYYVPVSYYREVYPQTAPTVVPTVSSTPSVIQQTTVVTAPKAPTVDLPTPPPAPPVLPAPTAVQKTKVGAGVP